MANPLFTTPTPASSTPSALGNPIAQMMQMVSQGKSPLSLLQANPQISSALTQIQQQVQQQGMTPSQYAYQLAKQQGIPAQQIDQLARQMGVRPPQH